MKHAKQPAVIFLLLVVALLSYANWRSAKQRDAEHELRLQAIGKMQDAISHCQPAVFLSTSTDAKGHVHYPEAVDAVPLMKYRENQTGYGCAFLPDGRYGDLWWSIIVENKGEKAHLEWNFNQRGKYKW